MPCCVVARDREHAFLHTHTRSPSWRRVSSRLVSRLSHSLTFHGVAWPDEQRPVDLVSNQAQEAGCNFG